MGDEQYNPMQHVEVREKVGIAGLYVETLQSGARMDSAAADVERMVIAAIHAAAKPLLAEVANLRDQMEATRAAAARERDRMRGNVDAWQARAEAAEQRAEAAEAALAAAHAEVAQARVDRAVLIGAFLSSLSPAVALDVLSGVGAPHNAAEALSIFSRNGLLPIEGEKKGPELLSYLRKMLARVFAEIKAGSTQ